MDDRQLIADLLSALEYHTEQTRPIQFSKVAIEAAREYLRKPAQQPAQQQEPFGYFRYDLRLDAWVQNREGQPGTPFYTSPPAQRQEPVAWMCTETKILYDHDTSEVDKYHGFKPTMPLYAHPAPQPSKPLTDAQIGAVAADIWGSILIAPQSYQAFARAIEAAHGIKENT